MLAIWRLKEHAYGVTIRKKIAEITGITYSYGTLYSALDQLTAKDYVNKIEGEPTAERGGRRKIYYTLSPTGIDALKKAREIHDAIWNGVGDLSFEETK